MLALRRDAARATRQESAYAESEYQRAKQRHEQQAHDREQTQATAAEVCALDAAGQATLKKLYREAVFLAHPDRAAPAWQAAATVAFQQVQAAYQRQDIAALQAQLEQLRQGNFGADAPALTTVAALQARRDGLAATHAALLHELAELRGSEAFALAAAEEKVRAEYAATNRAALEAERDRLRRQLAVVAEISL